jgi:hypothetical protein
MKKLIQQLAAGAVLALAASAASAGEVTVEYIQPENFSDLTTSGEREEILRNLAAHFVKLGAKLPATYKLRVFVQDIDMAGSERQSGARTDLRATSRGEFPRMALHYMLVNNDQVVTEGDAELRDMSFMDRPNRYMSNDPIRYEKRMVDVWFDKTIAPAAGPAS